MEHATQDTALPDLLITTEVAAWLRTTPSALFTQRHRGEAPGSLAIRVGRRLLWRRQDLESYLERRAAERGAR